MQEHEIKLFRQCVDYIRTVNAEAEAIHVLSDSMLMKMGKLQGDCNELENKLSIIKSLNEKRRNPDSLITAIFEIDGGSKT